MEAFPVTYGGGTVQEVLHDYRKSEACFDAFFRDFQPDLGWDPVMFYPAEVMEALGLNWLQVAGQPARRSEQPCTSSSRPST